LIDKGKIMAVASPATTIPLDDLLALGSDARVEVIEGEIVEKPGVGILHSFIAGNVYRILYHFAETNGLGFVITGGLLYILDADAAHLRGSQVPDVSFVRTSSIPADWDMEKPFPGPPDLAVEVVSPGDDAEKLMLRVHKYLEAGTDQVWALYPKLTELHQFIRQPSGEIMITVYRSGDTLRPEALFPTLALEIDALFALPDIKQQTPE
jgi:Uma2 family endonuclease